MNTSNTHKSFNALPAIAVTSTNERNIKMPIRSHKCAFCFPLFPYLEIMRYSISSVSSLTMPPNFPNIEQYENCRFLSHGMHIITTKNLRIFSVFNCQVMEINLFVTEWKQRYALILSYFMPLIGWRSSSTNRQSNHRLKPNQNNNLGN